MARAVLWLSEVTAADEARVGGKAYALARLRQAGLPVPDGFVASAEASSEEIREAYGRLQGAVAVRSSGSAEDTGEASFAGQYLTALDVRGGEEVVAAVERCRASGGAGGAYARAVGTGGAGTMAVLVQRFVEPRAAGVAFTRHPADPGALLVESRLGRGEALVSGLVTPDRYVVDRVTEAVREGPAAGSLDEAALRAVTGLALEAERRQGRPQDVEWAVDAAGAVLLQSRPITVESDAGAHPGARLLTRANVGEVLPDPVTPLTASTIVAFLDHAMRASTDALGIGPRDDAPFMVLHQERLYLNLSLCLQVAGRLPGVTQGDAERLILGGGGPSAAAPAAPLRAWPGLLAVTARAARLAARLPGAIAGAERLVAALPRAAGATDAGLRRDLERLVDVGRAVAFAHVAASGASAVRLAVLGRLLGDHGARVNRLVAGLDGVESALPALALEALAARAAAEQGAWVERGAPWEEAPGALLEGLADILRRYGHRALSEGELRASTWDDDPAPLVAALRVRARSAVPAGFSQAVKAGARRAEEEAVLSRLGPLRRVIVRRALQGAQDWVRRREHTKSLAVRMVAHARTLAREAGARLAAGGRLESADDVYFLTLDEVTAALSGEAVPVPRLRRRRRRFAAAALVPAPRRVDLDAPGDEEEAPGPRGEGIGVSAGVGAGPARVLQPGDVPRLEPGEVLVAPVLDAALGPLLSSASGAVAELGGMLSHGAVVARELGVPCVVDVRDATRWIRTGDRVVVDGGRGRVRLGNAPPVAGEGGGEGATLHTAADPRDEAFHPPRDHPRARESVYLNVQDPAAGLFLVSSAGVRTGDRGEAVLALALPDGRVLFALERVRPRLEGSVAVGGLRVGWDPVSLRFQGRMAPHEGVGFPPAPLPLLLTPRTVEVSLELAFSPTTPAVDLSEGLHEDARVALGALGAHHIEQSGGWSGTAVVDGTRFVVAGTGSRDHTWGLRDWDAADWWRLFTVRFDADLAVHALAVCAGGHVVEGGFVWRGGRAERITRVQYSGAGEGTRLRSLLLEVATAGGEPLRLEGTVQRTVPIPVQLDRRPWRHLAGRPYRLVLHENFTRYATHGRTGYGMAEITERPL
jgi:pyruvate,water dikinase